MRLFIAVNFPAEVKETIVQIRDSLKQAARHGNYSLDENLHLTLVFLGECDDRQVKTVKAIMDDAWFNTLTLSLDKVGRFRRNNGDIWWIGLKPNQALTELQTDLMIRLIQEGFTLENRIFSPHITIGRQVKTRPQFDIPQFPQIYFTIESIELMKSECINGKLTYTQIYSIDTSD